MINKNFIHIYQSLINKTTRKIPCSDDIKLMSDCDDIHPDVHNMDKWGLSYIYFILIEPHSPHSVHKSKLIVGLEQASRTFGISLR